jgi:hypothetical protein
MADMCDMLEQQQHLVELLCKNAEMTPQDQTSSIAKEKLKFTGLNHDY